jgi:hypothetical protein
MKLLVRHLDGLRFQVISGEHAIGVDAALQDGGAGTALSAPQLFAGAVGACILEFVANSCRLNGLLIERLSLEMACEEAVQPRRIAAIQATIHIEPEPPENVRSRLLGVAMHATLLNTLVHSPDVVVQFSSRSG